MIDTDALSGQPLIRMYSHQYDSDQMFLCHRLNYTQQTKYESFLLASTLNLQLPPGTYSYNGQNIENVFCGDQSFHSPFTIGKFMQCSIQQTNKSFSARVTIYYKELDLSECVTRQNFKLPLLVRDFRFLVVTTS